MDIAEIRTAVAKVAERFPISKASLFGSRANGTCKSDSDVDLIMEFSAPITLITLAAITEQLEQILSIKVDVVHGPIKDTDFISVDKEIEIYAA